MDNKLLGQDGLGASFVFNQVVFAHKDPVGELLAVGENRLLKPKATRQKIQCTVERFDEFSLMIRCGALMRSRAGQK